MAIPLEGLVGATLILAVLYLMLGIFAAKRLKYLESVSTKLNTRKLFVMSCLLTCILRVLSFATLTTMNYSQFDRTFSSKTFDDDGRDFGQDSDFFDRAILVLFDMPDFCCVSAYVLLLVVWGETYLLSRRHWLSANAYKRSWMLGYLIFNISLYSVQVLLYFCLFFPQIDQQILVWLIYLTQAVINFLVPIFWIFVFWGLAAQFAGFPFSSVDAQERLKILGRVATMWTVARLSFGIVAMTSVLQGWLTEASHLRILYGIMVMLVFVLCEMVPIALTLQMNVLMAMVDKTKANTEANALSSNRSTLPGMGSESSNNSNGMRTSLLTPHSASGDGVEDEKTDQEGDCSSVTFGPMYRKSVGSTPRSNSGSSYSALSTGPGPGRQSSGQSSGNITPYDHEYDDKQGATDSWVAFLTFGAWR